MSNTSATKKAVIVTLKELELSNRFVAGKENVSASTVSRINARYGANHQFEAKSPRPGRPSKISESDAQKAMQMLSSGKAKNASDLKRKLFPDIHVDTVRKALKKRGLNAYQRESKPLLTRGHRQKRTDWAERHCYWSEEDWCAVIFSDESKFNVFGSDGRDWCWRRPGEANDPVYVKKRVKHSNGSVMVWGCITRYGVGELHRIDGIMDRFIYVDILSQSLLSTLNNHNLDRSTIYFQQDGDPKHRSKHATGWFDLEGIDLLPWCPNSPDMNIIENVWAHLDRMVRARDPLPKNCEELWVALKEEWEKIDQAFIDKLYDSMPTRVRELLKAKGGNTRY